MNNLHTAAHRTKRLLFRAWRAFPSLYHSLYFPPTVICLAVMVVTIWTWNASRHSLQGDLQAAMNTRITATEQLMQGRLHSYEEILRGGVGLFRGSDEVTRTDWHNYLAAFNIPENYVSVQSIGFAKIVTADEIPALTAYMATQDIPNFTVTPQDPAHSPYVSIMYLEPDRGASTAQAFGFDLASDPIRAAALVRARDTNLPTITSRITPLIAPKSGVSGFNMYLPFYDVHLPSDTPAERQAAVRGYAFAGFRANTFFEGSVTPNDRKNMGLRIMVHNDASRQPLYQSDNYAALSKQAHILNTVRPLQSYGQTWYIRYVFNRAGLVSRAQLNRPYGVLVFGSFIAISIAFIVWLLLRARARELSIQKEHDVELAKDELLSLASHQLRTPATGVKQYLGMVLQGFAGPVAQNQQSLLEKAYASNDRQLQVINEILHLAKIDAGRIVLARQKTNVNELLGDIINEQQADIKTANHRLTLRLPKRPVQLHVDAHMLRMAIENLVSNAIKYTPPNGKIAVSLRKDWGNAYITIRDNGVGIASDDHTKLFKQFSRLPNEMSQRVGGTGVGLYLTKHLVELHGGSVNVRSTQGHGSTFTITLPLTDSSASI